MVHFIATLLAGVVVTYAFPGQLQSFANAMGIIASLCGVLQYFPQIYTTWKMQRVGSLSVPMMCVQTPGGYLFAASLAARLGWAGWSTWCVYVVLATLQGVLLGMAAWFEIRDREAKKRGQADSENESGSDEETVGVGCFGTEANERSPLLRRNTGSKGDIKGDEP